MTDFIDYGARPLKGDGSLLELYGTVVGEVGVVAKKYPIGDGRRYGLAGDGSDETTKLANWTASAAAAGVLPVIPAGTYITKRQLVFMGFTGRLRLPGVKIKAHASWQRAALGTNDGVVVVRTCSRLAFEFLEVDGNKDAIDLAILDVDGIYVDGGSDVTVQRVKVRNAVTDSISSYNCDGFKTRRNNCANQGRHGIVYQQCDDADHRNNEIVGIGDRGFVAAGVRDNGGIGILGTVKTHAGYRAFHGWNKISNTSDTASKTEGYHAVRFIGNEADTFGKDGFKQQPFGGITTDVQGAEMRGNRARNLQHWRQDGSGYIVGHSVKDFQYGGNYGYGSDGAADTGFNTSEFGVLINRINNTYDQPDGGYADGNFMYGMHVGINLFGPNCRARGGKVKSAAPLAAGVWLAYQGVSADGIEIDVPGTAALVLGVPNCAARDLIIRSAATGVDASSVGCDYTTITGCTFDPSVAIQLKRTKYNHDIVHSNVGVTDGTLDQLQQGARRVVFVNNAVPTTGTFAVGDLAVNLQPASGTPTTWVCTAAGTMGTGGPATWLPVGIADLLAQFNTWTAAQTLQRSSGSNAVQNIKVAGDAVARRSTNAIGSDSYGDGTNAADVVVGRVGTNTYGTTSELQGGAVRINSSGTKLTLGKVYTPSLTPVAVAANTSVVQTFTVAGLTTADKVTVNPPANTAGIIMGQPWVSAADTLSIPFGNLTAGALTPAAGSYAILATRS